MAEVEGGWINVRPTPAKKKKKKGSSYLVRFIGSVLALVSWSLSPSRMIACENGPPDPLLIRIPLSGNSSSDAIEGGEVEGTQKSRQRGSPIRVTREHYVIPKRNKKGSLLIVIFL